jgi:signal transduction histidine kinase
VPQIRAIDAVWLIFLCALAALGMTRQEHSLYEWLVLLALGGVQIAEARLDVSSDRTSAALAIAVKLVLCYWLVAETDGVESSYYLIFLLPIVSAASLFELGGALLATLVASGLYLSFLFYVDFQTYYLLPEGERELTVRVLFFFLSAIVVNRLATENRRKTERLAEANRDLREAQAEVRRSERLAALGQLSAGLAHEIRNPLGVISASAEVLSKHVSKENEVAREVAGFIRSEVDRSNALVSHFLDFARPSPLQRDMNNLNEVVERAVTQLRDTLGEASNGLRVEKALGDLPRFSFDSTLIESAVFNLLLNGYEAMPSGGPLRVSTGRDGATAWVEVADSGVGIAGDQLESIFNPFFTTKPRGVGLGLAMVSRYIDNHGGKITVTSRPGEGAAFRIHLPLESKS